MTVYGYARVSTTDQDLTIQQEALRAAGCDLIRSEIVTGSSRSGRVELELLLDFLQAGDTLMVTRIDRLARSIKDLQDIVYLLKGRGIILKATEQPVTLMTPFPGAWRARDCLLSMFVIHGVSSNRPAPRLRQVGQAPNTQDGLETFWAITSIRIDQAN